MAPALPQNRRSRARVCILAVVVGAASAALVLLGGASDASGAFVAGGLPQRMGQRVQLRAEDTASSSSSVALVKVTEENTMTTASVIGGLAGLWLGGVWLGAGAFAAAAYIARSKDNDVAKALKGTSKVGLEALNFVSALNDKYEISGKVGSALSQAIEKADSKGQVKAALDNIGEAASSVDRDVGLKDTFGSLATSASELASQAVTKAIEINDQYKITDKIKEKIDEVTKSTK